MNRHIAFENAEILKPKVTYEQEEHEAAPRKVVIFGFAVNEPSEAVIREMVVQAFANRRADLSVALEMPKYFGEEWPADPEKVSDAVMDAVENLRPKEESGISEVTIEQVDSASGEIKRHVSLGPRTAEKIDKAVRRG